MAGDHERDHRCDDERAHGGADRLRRGCLAGRLGCGCLRKKNNPRIRLSSLFDCWDRPPYPSQRAHDRTANELFERLAAALAHVEVESGAARLATGLDAFFSFVEERRDAWRICFATSPIRRRPPCSTASSSS
jgi:hypothetical protein